MIARRGDGAVLDTFVSQPMTLWRCPCGMMTLRLAFKPPLPAICCLGEYYMLPYPERRK